MNIQQTSMGRNVAVISVQGVIKLGESGKELSNHLKHILETGKDSVLVDLSKVDEVDSTGLGELVGYLQLFWNQGRHLAVMNPTAKIRKLFEFMNLHKVLPIYDDLDQALSSISQS